MAEKAVEEFQGGKEEDSSERPSTRRPRFKSKTNSGPANRDGPTNAPGYNLTGQNNRANERVCERIIAFSIPLIAARIPENGFCQPLATVIDAASLLRDRKTTRFLYLRETEMVTRAHD